YIFILNCVSLSASAVTELTPEPRFSPDSEGFLSFNYSAVGKPAPRISLFPSRILNRPPEEYLAQNPNGTITVTKMYTISVETVRSLGLQHLIMHMDHPLRNEEKIVPLSEKQECATCSSTCICIVSMIFVCVLISTLLILYFCWRKIK
ncbi:hypothetical protein H1C71_024277, partial [Ictidomys tridecemlineatus]